MVRLRKIGVISWARLLGAIMGLIGLVAGIVYSFGGAIYDVITTGSLNSGSALAFLALIGMPIAFAIYGVIVGAIGAFLYNLVALRIGGVELDFSRTDDVLAKNEGESL